LPHSFIDFAAFINKFTPACSFTINPITYIIIAIGINVSAVTMIDVIFKLTFINDMIDLLTDTLNSSIIANLTYNEFVVFALAKLQCLVNRFRAILNDVLKLKRAQLRPFFLHRFESNSGHVIIFWFVKTTSYLSH
jgi:hypothetical protein